ncbi:phosphonate metabolism transcriptional regulator PhnF [Phreatobacter sp. AB_2022a]|uniref:phosphonate metabolism transcriptional regulator PhnF n=1 Tax=Phreatobacter sp. AB_2022a TaxID=3003134 RepID=UPI002286F7E3|nr:phosphonate metabolism transcriptional regulator PhnF [Phreatobacter sp. AB_2022a]MCZ0733109.1 phosphonate metabolism transcriptional regulator PhnF [Phreatobacter sp. AB_2022a]
MSGPTQMGADAMANNRFPVWRLIQSELEAEIRSGLIGPGDQLPSESELAERFGVNRHTVRTALANLAIAGLARARRGRGVFVEDRPPEYRISRESRWSEIEREMNATPSGRLVGVSERPASAAVADMLAIGLGAPVLLVETVRGSTPALLIYSYHVFDRARFAGIDQAVARTGSYTEALAAFGVERFYRASTWIDCRMPRPREAEALSIPLDAPVLVMMYVDRDAGDRPILYGNAVIPNGSMVVRVDTL